MGFFDDLLKDAFSNDPNNARGGIKGSTKGPETNYLTVVRHDNDQ
jgi:hypothetical protein